MIFCRLSSCGSLVPVDPPGNSLEPVTKKRFNSNTRPRDLFLTDCLNRSTQEKSFPNTGDACWRSNIEIGVEAGSSVTTNHMFWPNERRKRDFLLPIRLPNPSFLESKFDQGARGPGGVNRMQWPKVPNRKAHSEIYSKWTRQEMAERPTWKRQIRKKVQVPYLSPN